MKIDYNCDAKNAFDGDVKKFAPIGVLTTITIATKPFTALQAKAKTTPTGTGTVMAALTSLMWNAMPQDPIIMYGLCNDKGKSILQQIIVTGTEAKVEFGVTILKPASNGEKYYVAFEAKTLKGVLDKNSGAEVVSVQDTPDSSVGGHSEPLFPFALIVAPDVSLAQNIDYATSTTDKLQLSWGQKGQ